MVRIMLACAAGMSTSLLVEKMKEAAKAKGVEAKIWAVPESNIKDNEGEFDVVLLGPQVRFKLKSVQKLAAGRYPVDVIEMQAYGTMNGAKVFDFALATLEKFNANK